MEQTPRPEAEAADVASIDAIVAALYDAISFEPSGSPDWDRLGSLFHPEGRLVPPRGDDSDILLPVLSVGEFAALSSEFIEDSGIDEKGFHEREITRRVERFGNVAHVMSAYESLFTADDPKPFSRGVNTIQLLHDQARWWVLSIAWAEEDEKNPIPENYLAS